MTPPQRHIVTMASLDDSRMLIDPLAQGQESIKTDFLNLRTHLSGYKRGTEEELDQRDCRLREDILKEVREIPGPRSIRFTHSGGTGCESN